jgi:hypothetical protein
MIIQSLREPKIADLEVSVRPKQQVLRLDVAISDIVRVEVGYGKHYVGRVESGDVYR